MSSPSQSDVSTIGKRSSFFSSQSTLVSLPKFSSKSQKDSSSKSKGGCLFSKIKENYQSSKVSMPQTKSEEDAFMKKYGAGSVNPAGKNGLMNNMM
ncbi:hypothetical protein FRC02_012436 [Tulasnella sp. 418]|nr:hypothetical protein FRC02_012436 [Tulasnella sp. 418]